ncbi:MAG: deoxyribose-phosphate aldolase [Desulfurispora sp.]|uniref:deoxyribose-phosphate aldolase n=1 Tax=Desulfurispora sp. TaxID=3014275 RepID=UPI00404A306D
MTERLTPNRLASFIDHTLLSPTATLPDIERLCAEARQYGFAAVCINPCYVPAASRALQDGPVGVCTVIGFPLGAGSTAAKVAEAAAALQNGATELDVVLNLGWLKSGLMQAVLDDLRAVVQTARQITPRALVKVILETCYLTPEEKILACELAVLAGADFVKTSTGLGSGGATREDVQLLRQHVPPHVGVKASGGIKTADQARAMLQAGATRLGTSSSLAIMQQLTGTGQS